MDHPPEALHIVQTLHEAGFVAYFAGGWVRDFLLKCPSDDIDIATNAPPETVQTLFTKTVPIGIAFGIVLVIEGKHQYEVATFRQDFDYQDGRRPSKIAFTTAEEDAKRRDFTINGMFYDPLKKRILDYVDGRKDLERKIIRAIGDPEKRIQEDRLRMIRGIRLSCRFGFMIEKETQKAILHHAKELFPAVAIERIVQELEKGKSKGNLKELLLGLHEFNLLAPFFPELSTVSLQQMQKQLEPLSFFPLEAPLIGFLLELFSDTSLPFQLDLCKRLKLSGQSAEFVSLLHRAKELTHQKTTRADWAHFYTEPSSSLCLSILAAHLSDKEKKAFQKEHEEQIQALEPFIQRIQTKNPVVTSSHLMKAGIAPGKTMGLLLKEAEKLSINEAIQDPEEVLKRLKNHSSWPNKI